jgi:hypothetical protein
MENNYKHTREDGKAVLIDWEITDTIDVHDSGCVDVALDGEDQYGNKYQASGNTQDGELVEVADIEEMESPIPVENGDDGILGSDYLYEDQPEDNFDNGW